MDRRHKIKMCAYGSCREEFYAKGDRGRSRKYCDKCRPLVVLAIAKKSYYNNKANRLSKMAKYRSEHPIKTEKQKTATRQYNKIYREKNREILRAKALKAYHRKRLNKPQL